MCLDDWRLPSQAHADKMAKCHGVYATFGLLLIHNLLLSNGATSFLGRVFVCYDYAACMLDRTARDAKPRDL